jgi:hypothetical protein
MNTIFYSQVFRYLASGLFLILLYVFLVFLFKRAVWKQSQKLMEQNKDYINFLKELDQKKLLQKNKEELENINAGLFKLEKEELSLKKEKQKLTEEITSLQKQINHSIKERSKKFNINKKENGISIKSKASNTIDAETKKVLKIVDQLLEKLPPKTINKFVKSKDFKTYRNVLNKVKNKN